MVHDRQALYPHLARNINTTHDATLFSVRGLRLDCAEATGNPILAIDANMVCSLS